MHEANSKNFNVTNILANERFLFGNVETRYIQQYTAQHLLVKISGITSYQDTIAPSAIIVIIWYKIIFIMDK